MSLITLQRVYGSSPPFPVHTYLVDRLWPRGISKAQLQGVVWLKAVAPSNDLRQWYHHHLDQWSVFCLHYQQQLQQSLALTPLYDLLRDNQPIMLLYGSKDPLHNHAIVLRDFLLNKLKST